MSLGSKIEDLLFFKKVSQRKMAQDLNISPSTLNNYIRDYREPDVETIKLIARYFNVNLDYLLEFGPLAEVASNKESFVVLDENEQLLLNIFRKLKREQREFFLGQIKMLRKLNSK